MEAYPMRVRLKMKQSMQGHCHNISTQNISDNHNNNNNHYYCSYSPCIAVNLKLRSHQNSLPLSIFPSTNSPPYWQHEKFSSLKLPLNSSSINILYTQMLRGTIFLGPLTSNKVLQIPHLPVLAVSPRRASDQLL